MARRALVDLDDLWTEHQLAELEPLHAQVPGLHLTLYAIPGMLGPVHGLKHDYPWITFGIHGAYHTHAEAHHLVEEDWLFFLGKALDMGYDKVFKAPNWEADDELEQALRNHGIVLHCHRKYQPVSRGLKVYRPEHPQLIAHTNVHSHLARNPSTDHWLSQPQFDPLFLARFTEFLSPEHTYLIVGQEDQ